MYRTYENPRVLEKELEELEKSYIEYYQEAQSKGELAQEWEIVCDISQEIAVLKDRINFAWQDEEYDMEREW